MIEITLEQNKRFQDFLKSLEKQIATNGKDILLDMAIIPLVLNIFGAIGQNPISNPKDYIGTDDCKAILKRKMPQVIETMRKGEVRHGVTNLYSNPERYGLNEIGEANNSFVRVYDLLPGRTRVCKYSWEKITIITKDYPDNSDSLKEKVEASRPKIEELETKGDNGSCEWIIEQILNDKEKEPVLIVKFPKSCLDEQKTSKISGIYLASYITHLSERDSESE